MSSTSSSDRSPDSRSAAESLASRYRHLFVLPSAPRLVIYGGAATLALTLISRGTGGILNFVLALVVFILSGSAISSALQTVDKRTIATFRRAQALLLGGAILWSLIALIGYAYGWAAGSTLPLTNALLFGAFICAGFEFIVINGAFEKNVSISLALSGIHPASTLLILRFPELSGHFDLAGASSGVLALAVIVAFPLLLKRRKTSHGYDTLSLFQAFMKTWTAGHPDELEGAIADHSEEVEVSTKVLLFRTKAGDTYLVLPGVHPGPFYPIGSYDLPGVISRVFKEQGNTMTLHRPGGHERNLATRADTLKYAQSVGELAKSISIGDEIASIRGPVYSKVGQASVSASAFGNDMIMTVSFAPLGSDDIDTEAEARLAEPASKFGFDASVVDAHNSIDPSLQSPAPDEPGWRGIYEAVRNAEPEPVSVAYAHSSEVGFAGKGDITENGMGLILIQTPESKSALILADANNSVPTIREETSRALASAGYELIEFCTSDSHNLAARGMTVERGYEALGEATPLTSLTDAAVRMAKLAESRLAPARYGSASMRSRVRVFGSRALEEFAAITQASSRFAGRYLRFALAAIAVLLAVSLVL